MCSHGIACKCLQAYGYLRIDVAIMWPHLGHMHTLASQLAEHTIRLPQAHLAVMPSVCLALLAREEPRPKGQRASRHEPVGLVPKHTRRHREVARLVERRGAVTKHRRLLAPC